MDIGDLSGRLSERGFTVDENWRTETGVPVNPESDKHVPYRHIRRDNSSFGFVDRDGRIILSLNYVPVAGTPRGEAVPKMIGQYVELVSALKDVGAHVVRDQKLEAAIKQAYNALNH